MIDLVEKARLPFRVRRACLLLAIVRRGLSPTRGDVGSDLHDWGGFATVAAVAATIAAIAATIAAIAAAASIAAAITTVTAAITAAVTAAVTVTAITTVATAVTTAVTTAAAHDARWSRIVVPFIHVGMLKQHRERRDNQRCGGNLHLRASTCGR